jgi:GH18 family chitinase
VKHWIQQGAPASKLILGAPAYGRSYTLSNANSPGIGASASGPGAVGPYTQESGFIGYNEVSVTYLFCVTQLLMFYTFLDLRVHEKCNMEC